MYKMMFHWEKEGKKGKFTVEALTVEECVDTAKEEIESFGAEMVDWYVI